MLLNVIVASLLITFIVRMVQFKIVGKLLFGQIYSMRICMRLLIDTYTNCHNAQHVQPKCFAMTVSVFRYRLHASMHLSHDADHWFSANNNNICP